MSLPQLSGDIFLTDGGQETCLIYDYHYDLPEFAAFPLLATETGRASLVRYYKEYVDMAKELGRGLVLATPTWRCSSHWGTKLGYTQDQLDQLNKDAVRLVADCGEGAVVTGKVGPIGDGYLAGKITVKEAHDYHRSQVSALASAGADLVCSHTFSSWEEGGGLAMAAKEVGIPLTVGFTVDIDGRLHSGQGLGEAIMAVDREAGSYPEYYTVNCAHPDHFRTALEEGQGSEWIKRIGEVLVNASKKSHEELDRATQLDSGDMDELAKLTADLTRLLPNLFVVGGCCGTKMEHVKRIGKAISLRAK